MEPTGALQPITSHAVVRDRPSGQNRGDREAFQRALKQHKEAAAEAPTEDEKAPVPPRLQKQRGGDRRDGQAHHVDVLA